MDLKNQIQIRISSYFHIFLKKMYLLFSNCDSYSSNDVFCSANPHRPTLALRFPVSFTLAEEKRGATTLLAPSSTLHAVARGSTHASSFSFTLREKLHEERKKMRVVCCREWTANRTRYWILIYYLLKQYVKKRKVEWSFSGHKFLFLFASLAPICFGAALFI